MDEDKDLRNGFTLVGVIVVTLTLAIWSYSMFGPQSDAAIGMQRGYVQKVVPNPGSTTIWTKP